MASSPAQIFYLGYLWMLWDDKKQTWHDKVVGSSVVRALTEPATMDVTTVADDLVVIHDGRHAPLRGLAPATDHDSTACAVRRCDARDGELLCRVATVNDVHFGETEAGRLGERPSGPIRRRRPASRRIRRR